MHLPITLKYVMIYIVFRICRKIWRHLCVLFFIVYATRRYFFPVLYKGVTYNFPIETPQKTSKFQHPEYSSNQIVRIRTLIQNHWSRHLYQNFWVSINFATCLVKKIITSNIVIWVFKRSGAKEFFWRSSGSPKWLLWKMVKTPQNGQILHFRVRFQATHTTSTRTFNVCSKRLIECLIQK